MTKSREIRLKSRPRGEPTLDDFELAEVSVPTPQAGEVRVRNLWMSVDPWMLRAMREAIPSTEAPPASKFGSAVLGQALQGSAVGEVIKSGDAKFSAGDIVVSLEGWREEFTIAASALELINSTEILPKEAYLGPAGLTGLVAFAGLDLLDVGEQDVLFVSAAAGAVGSMVCQLAKLKGATVIGSAGGPEKCKYLLGIGVDHVIDYKNESDLSGALAAASPDGISAFFDNVGGKHLGAAIDNARPHGQILLAGLIASMNGDPEPVPADLMQVVQKRLRIEGFSAGDHFHRMPELRTKLADWFATDAISATYSVFEGIQSAPEAFLGLLSGANTGKMLVRLS